MPSSIGHRIGPHEILAHIGAGGIAAVLMFTVTPNYGRDIDALLGLDFNTQLKAVASAAC